MSGRNPRRVTQEAGSSAAPPDSNGRSNDGVDSSALMGVRPDGTAGQDGGSSVCRRASVWLRKRLDDVVGEIYDEITEGVEIYRDQARTEQGRAELELNVRGIIELFLTLLAEQRRLNEEERAEVERIGVQRGDQGFDLASIEEAGHIAVGYGRRYLFTAAREVADAPSVLDVLLVMDDLLADFHHDLRSAFETGYRRRHDEIETDRRRGREAFLRRLLEGIANGPAIAVEAAAVGVPNAPAILLATLRPNGAGDTDFEEKVARYTRSIPAEVEGPIHFVGECPHAVSLVWGLRASEFETLDKAAQELELCVVTSEPTGLPDVHSAYHSLRALVQVAAHHAGGGVHAGRRFRHLRIITAAPAAEQIEFVRHVLDAVFADPRYALTRLCQLRAYYESPDSTIKGAARQAGKAATTIPKTLDRIGELTGYHPIRDRFVVELALQLYDHHASHLPAPGDSWWAGNA